MRRGMKGGSESKREGVREIKTEISTGKRELGERESESEAGEKRERDRWCE